LTTAVGPARAQRTAADLESARQLYNQGIALRDAGDVRGALEKFRAAHALGNTPVTGVELCKTHAAIGQPVEAREVCLGVARIPPNAQETQRSQDARAEAARIAEDMKARIGSIRLKIFGVPQGRDPIVTVDGVLVPPPALGEARAVNPGNHVVTARVGNGAETRAALETREGEHRDLDLTVYPGQDPGPGAPPPMPLRPDERPRDEKKGGSGAAIAAFIVAGVAGVVGIGGALAASDAKSELDEKCPQKRCGREDHDTLDSGVTWGNVATGAFIVGGIALTVGLVSLASSGSRSSQPKTKPVTPSIGIGGAGVYGSF
jgi:hypothetical protein